MGARASARAAGSTRCEWWVGWSATPADLAERLVGLGFVPDDEEATLTGMSIDREPPAAPHVEVRRIETLDEQLAALEVDWDVWELPEAERVPRAGRTSASASTRTGTSTTSPPTRTASPSASAARST